MGVGGEISMLFLLDKVMTDIEVYILKVLQNIYFSLDVCIREAAKKYIVLVAGTLIGGGGVGY